MANYKPKGIAEDYGDLVKVEVFDDEPKVFLTIQSPDGEIFGDAVLGLAEVDELIIQLQCALEIASDHLEADCE